MILVAAPLAIIGLMFLGIGDNVLYADNIKRLKVIEFEECRDNKFVGEGCEKYADSIQYEKCVAEQDLESRECYKYKMWIQSDIFEECRANRDMVSSQCQEYTSLYEAEPEV